MFMNLERVADTPAPLPPAPAPISKTPPLFADIGASPRDYQPTDEPVGHTLAQFPDYVFDDTGTPTRVKSSGVGPAPVMGEVKPARTTSKSRYFVLATTDGRITITDSRIRDMISGKIDRPTNFFTIPDFTRTIFDSSGRAYIAKSRRPHKFHMTETRSGVPVREYRIWSESLKRERRFTDIAARRWNDGRCSLTSAALPPDCVLMGDEFPDFAVDTYTGTPYRIQSSRYAIYEPVSLEMRRDGRYFIPNYAGDRVLFTPLELLAFVGAQNSQHTPEKA